MADDVSLVEVMARLVASFAIIIGLLGGAVYVFRRRGMLRVVPGGGAPQKRLRVVERQNLSRSSSVALVRVGARAYLLGATDASVSLLVDVTETIADAEAADEAARTEDSAHQGTGAPGRDNPLHSARMDVVGAILQRMTRRA
jgi:flagellar protein FliO/FliZ